MRTEARPTSTRYGGVAAGNGTVERLAATLSREIDGEVRFGPGDRALYSTDASNYRQVPIGVVVPRSVADVVRTIELCDEAEVPILSRGGGTSLAGQCCNVAVVLDHSKYLNRVLEIDAERRTARVQPGVVLDELRRRAELHGLTFGPDPATHSRCTLGGMIGNNSCGVHSLMSGKTVDNVEELEILTADGVRMRVGRTDDAAYERALGQGGRPAEIHRRLRELRDRTADLVHARYPDIPRRVSGYNLDELLPERGFHLARALVGSESTCVTVLEATVRLVPHRGRRTLVVLGYRDVFDAADQVPEILSYGPIGLEGIDEVLLEDMRKKELHLQDLDYLPEGGGWLLVEFGADEQDEADELADRLVRELGGRDGWPRAKVYRDPEEEAKVWEVRESGLGATARVPGQGDTWPGWEDSSVAPEQLGRYLRELRGLYDEYDYNAALYGHFGQGCIHTRIDFDLRSADGIRRFRSFVEEAADLVVGLGGSLSGEHGDGQSRAELLGKMFGPELVDAFREFKSIWDPGGRMNPGKVVDPYPLDANLRLGADYRPTPVETEFAFSRDDGDLTRAALRCVGVGLCRRTEGGVMCPSYMVTREEEHSTRGRARLLFEMLQGDPLEGGWRDEAVHDALDLCLACKACKSDCPVDVDMATYKAEFLSHYYRGRLRPRSAYALGLTPWAARAASKAPLLANAAVRAPGLGGLIKRLGGIAPERRLPSFALQPFSRWFRDRRRAADAPDGRATKGAVVLWPDTFNEHYTPAVARAAVEVLEHAGYRVTIPPRPLCCGRPLYDFGMLRLARRQLRQLLEVLRPAIRRGIPVIGLEPSCLAVFRDELPEMLPNDEDAARLAKQSLLLSEFLEREGWEPPPLHRKALVQVHCHHHAVMGFEPERSLMERAGLELEIPDSGCCGMAGAFGFEREHYDVSIAAGERVLLPAVRAADPDTLILADGFSCREQIEQSTDRRPMHLAEVLAIAVREAETRGDAR